MTSVGCYANQPVDPDQMVIDSLRKNGANLSKPHTIDFFFDFSKSANAAEVCKILESQGFEPHLSSTADFHTCRAVRVMIPDLKAIQNMTMRFDALASKYDGDYDGWGTVVEK